MIIKHQKIVDDLNHKNYRDKKNQLKKQEPSLAPIYLIVFILALLAILFGPREVHAGIETDALVGNCAGLLIAMNKPDKAADAIGFADNRDRAVKFGRSWLQKIKSFSGNESRINSLIYTASADCRSLGIRASE